MIFASARVRRATPAPRRSRFTVGARLLRDGNLVANGGTADIARSRQSVTPDPIRKLADCDASRLEDDIPAAWYCYQFASGPSRLNCRGRSAPLLKFGTSFRREGKPRGCRGPLSKFGIEKDVERRNLAIANNDEIQSGVVWGLAFRA